jgi:carboxypeptidase T
MKIPRLATTMLLCLSNIDSTNGGGLRHGDLDHQGGRALEPLNVDGLTYPLVGTAVVKDSAAAYELDVIPPPEGFFSNEVNSIAFLVHDAEEASMILSLSGLSSVKFDDEFLNQLFYKDNFLSAQAFAGAAGTYTTVAGFDCYRDLAGSYSWLDDIALGTYPGLNVTVTDIGDSYLKTINQGGYDIRLLKISSTNPAATTKAPFFAMFGIHAREMAPPELGMRFTEMLLSNYGTDAEVTAMLDHTDIHLVIQSNPDGRYVAEINQSWFQRKNMHAGTDTCSDGNTGIDLNRNFPFKWGPAWSGSSGSQCSQTYRGESAASEPETQAIRDYVSSIFPESQRKADPAGANLDDKYADLDAVGVFFDIHAYGNLIIWPWAYEERYCADEEEFLTISRKFKSFNGYALAGPFQPDFLYAANGVTDDFAYGELGAAAFTLEIGSAFYQSCSDFDPIVAANLPVLLYAGKVAGAPYKIPLGPDVMSLGSPFTGDASFAPTVPGNGTLSIVAQVSDNARSDIKNTPTMVDTMATGSQFISSVQVYLDGHPYDDSPPTPIDMTGPTDSTTATFSVDLDIATLGLSYGSHVIHIVATDSGQFSGPVSSRYFDVCDETDPTCSGGGGGGNCLDGGLVPDGSTACTDSNKSACCSGTCTGGKPELRTCQAVSDGGGGDTGGGTGGGGGGDCIASGGVPDGSTACTKDNQAACCSGSCTTGGPPSSRTCS